MTIHSSMNTIEKRKKRIADVIALKEPDRVPFAPKMGTAYCKAGGIDVYEAMIDIRAAEKGIRAFLKRYETELGFNQAHQIVDEGCLEEKEYDDFLMDPTHFFLTKLYPRRHAKLGALSKISFRNVFEYGHYQSLSVFRDTDVREALLTLFMAGEHAGKWAESKKYLNKVAEEMETPPSNLAALSAPYDMFADNIRGYLNVPMDLFSIPDKVERAIRLMEYYSVPMIEAMRANGADSCWIPLHGGMDDFMSVDTYLTHYWSSLQRTIERLVEKGITPFVFCEGKYDTRLEILRDVPPKKVVYMFEKVDLARAKKILGDVACISGNLPGTMLLRGTPDAVVEETKRMIDACAQGGGFIMDTSMSIDNNYDEALLDAWYETTMTYGVYK